jgi:hypothetical protein
LCFIAHDDGDAKRVRDGSDNQKENVATGMTRTEKRRERKRKERWKKDMKMKVAVGIIFLCLRTIIL